MRRGVMAVCLLAGCSQPPSGAPVVANVGGVRVEFLVSSPPMEGQDVEVGFAFTDAHTGVPLGGLNPGAWMELRRGSMQEKCEDKLRGILNGSLARRPTVDLNAYQVLTLNDDGTISVVDPLFSYGGSRLLDFIKLDAPGEDWIQTSNGKAIFVSVPDAKHIAVIDTSNWDITRRIPVGGRPGALLQQDRGPLVVTLERGVAVVDTQHHQLLGQLSLDAPVHNGAVTADGSHAYVLAGDAIIIVKLQPEPLIVQRVPAFRPVDVAWSSAASAAYVTQEDGALLVLDGDSHAVVQRVVLEPGLGPIKFAPDG